MYLLVSATPNCKGVPISAFVRKSTSLLRFANEKSYNTNLPLFYMTLLTRSVRSVRHNHIIIVLYLCLTGPQPPAKQVTAAVNTRDVYTESTLTKYLVIGRCLLSFIIQCLKAEVWWGNMRERNHLEDAGVDASIIFKRILTESAGRTGMD
jgi:hypothetical protein